jgi:hypothetical protein
MKNLFLHTLLLLTLLSSIHAQRGRVQIQDGTLVTDQGTLLRGATDLSPYEGFIWEDIKEDIHGIKSLGLNSLHLYAESADVFEPGERVAYIDSIVKWTREDSLYLIMTATWHKHYGAVRVADIEFIREFWRFYAPRYKDETHMIFEICNEPPVTENTLLDSLTLAMEISVYDTIRKYAPETHVQFFSLPNPIEVDSMLNNINELGDEINWNNASIAVHGYGPSSEQIRTYLTTLQDSGYAVTMTEPASILNKYLNLAITRVCEEEFISYANFISLEGINHDYSVYKSRIEGSEIRWSPDFGVWPENLMGINYLSPYSTIGAAYYDEGYDFNNIWPLIIINFIRHNSYASFYNFNFEDAPLAFEAECCSELDGGNIEVHLDSLNGPVVAVCPIGSSGDWDVFEKYSCNIITPFSGIHNIYLVFKDTGEDGLFDLKSIVFKNTITGINEPSALSGSHSFLFYPNPAKEFITVNTDMNTILEIYNIYGQLLWQEKLFAGNKILQISNLTSGSYILKAYNETEIYSEILIIE